MIFHGILMAQNGGFPGLDEVTWHLKSVALENVRCRVLQPVKYTCVLLPPTGTGKGDSCFDG